MSVRHVEEKSTGRLKSAIKSDTSNAESKGSLTFKKSDMINVYHRDYGLLKVGATRLKTVYPRRDEQRKSGNRDSAMSVRSSTSEFEQLREVNKYNAQFNDDNGSNDFRPMRFDTPHPKKGRPVSSRLLSKELSERKASHRISLPPMRGGSFTSTNSFKTFQAIGTPHPKKNIILNPKNLANRLHEINEDLTKSIGKIVKKVVLVSPRASFCSFAKITNISNNSLASGEPVDESNNLSFEERRRLFHIGEFTIAKNGKKMSEVPMMKSSNQDDISTTWQHVDEEAIHVLETFIKTQGLTKTPNNMIAATFVPRRNSARFEATLGLPNQLTNMETSSTHLLHTYKPKSRPPKKLKPGALLHPQGIVKS